MAARGISKSLGPLYRAMVPIITYSQSKSQGTRSAGMTLRIRQMHFEQLRRHAVESYPRECCGVLVGDFDSAAGRTVHSVAPCGNACTASPEKRYRIDPAELVRIQREARVAGHA